MLDIKDTFIKLLFAAKTDIISDKFQNTRWVDCTGSGYDFLLDNIIFSFSNYCENLEIYKITGTGDRNLIYNKNGWVQTKYPSYDEQLYNETMLILEKIDYYIADDKMRSRQHDINNYSKSESVEKQLKPKTNTTRRKVYKRKFP